MKPIITAAFAFIGGLFAGWVDMHNDEVQATVLVVLVVAGLSGLATPRHAWRWGLLAGLGVPAAYLIALALHTQLREWPNPNISATLIALAPGMIGAYSGAGVRTLLKK